jgi:hypothetical protein
METNDLPVNEDWFSWFRIEGVWFPLCLFTEHRLWAAHSVSPDIFNLRACKAVQFLLEPVL